ncbi:hypothetical protein EXIGLDRAFT_123177 [Exidia glandulosa HHB12029]|uniref:Uncharacterized protein n=1 Tax=Exidia glandulosa HHB12029 TaxID=1314781 RepID=A0A165NJA6_EXIGL|nr:hypothetical protein EXIGLDRAFT_123177 [Exidia glandulosa HHB12029]
MLSVFRLSFFLLLLLPVQLAYGQQSQCTPECPQRDGSNFTATTGPSSSLNGTLFCSYPSSDGANAMDFYCTYSKTTGNLVVDHDMGLCASSASGRGCSGATTTLDAASKLSLLLLPLLLVALAHFLSAR